MTGEVARVEPDTVVGEHYRLCRLLGEGGMGQVWEAVHTPTDWHVALKFLKSDKDEDRRRFAREVRAASAVQHPNVIGVHDFIELPDATLVIVMDLLHGETLGAVLRRDGRISVPSLAAVLLQVVSALQAAHAAGVVHRDLKPENIFLCDGVTTGAPVKVLDFGVAKLTAAEGLAARTLALTGTGSMVGTPYYMSPEQVFSEKDLDGRADVWSLGIVMYECLAGTRPTEADTIGRVLKLIMAAEFEPLERRCADVPAEIASLVARMLSVDPDRRPGLTEVRAVLEPHASVVPPSFPGAARDPDVDPHAATVSGPGATVRSAPPPALAREEAVPHADTNSAVSMLPPRRLRATKRVVAAVAVALIGGTLAARQWAHGEAPGLAGAISSTSLPKGEPSTVPSGVSSANPAMPPSAPAPSPGVSVAAVTAAIGSTDRTPAKPGPTARGVAPPPKPSCSPDEVVSEGHCCARGHVWQSGRCQRPFATSF